MREIKFRAWDIEGRGFIAGFNMFNYHGYYNKGLKKSIQRYDSEWMEDKYILEQYTGLKDKNGQEIYFRSNIVEAVISDDVMGTENKISGVLFIDLKRFKISMHGHEDLNLQFADSLEIIGNIHENPELSS